MAVTQQVVDGAKPYLEVQKVSETETCSVQWTIPNWKKVRLNVAAVNSQKVTFETSQYGKWVIGLKTVRCGDGSHQALVYWKLVEIFGNSKQLEVTVFTRLLDRRGEVYTSDETKKVVGLNEIIETTEEFLDVLTTSHEDEHFCIHTDGSVKYSLQLITKLPASNKRQLHTKEFSRKSLKNLCENQASLFTNGVNADLKFVARDGSVIPAHKTVLMARCPVFASMLGTEFREGTSGVIKLEDLSGKTMNILLYYFYTGSLLPTWCDDDIILEFAYAAGKYQMNLVLELLDNTLGMHHQREACHVDVQLLNLTDKLSLKRAEYRLLQRVVKKIQNVKESKDLFYLFGYENEDVAKMASLLGSEIIEESNMMEIMETLLGDQGNDEQEKGMRKRGLHVLALVQRKNENRKLEKLKKFILNWYCKTVAKFTSAKELFNFFGYENL